MPAATPRRDRESSSSSRSTAARGASRLELVADHRGDARAGRRARREATTTAGHGPATPSGTPAAVERGGLGRSTAERRPISRRWRTTARAKNGLPPVAASIDSARAADRRRRHLGRGVSQRANVAPEPVPRSGECARRRTAGAGRRAAPRSGGCARRRCPGSYATAPSGCEHYERRDATRLKRRPPGPTAGRRGGARPGARRCDPQPADDAVEEAVALGVGVGAHGLRRAGRRSASSGTRRSSLRSQPAEQPGKVGGRVVRTAPSSASMKGWYGSPVPSRLRPLRTVAPTAARTASSSSMRDLPAPGSPLSSTMRVEPSTASARAASMRRSSSRSADQTSATAAAGRRPGRSRSWGGAGANGSGRDVGERVEQATGPVAVPPLAQPLGHRQEVARRRRPRRCRPRPGERSTARPSRCQRSPSSAVTRCGRTSPARWRGLGIVVAAEQREEAQEVAGDGPTPPRAVVDVVVAVRHEGFDQTGARRGPRSAQTPARMARHPRRIDARSMLCGKSGSTESRIGSYQRRASSMRPCWIKQSEATRCPTGSPGRVRLRGREQPPAHPRPSALRSSAALRGAVDRDRLEVSGLGPDVQRVRRAPRPRRASLDGR